LPWVRAALVASNSALIGVETRSWRKSKLLYVFTQPCGEEGEAALMAAAAFASSYKARLSLVHVVEMPPVNLAVDFSPYKKDLMDSADFKLRELKGKLVIDASHVGLDGSVPEAIH
jgi:hypothetical protein